MGVSGQPHAPVVLHAGVKASGTLLIRRQVLPLPEFEPRIMEPVPTKLRTLPTTASIRLT